MTLLGKLRAGRTCRTIGHDMRYAGTVFDGDGGMGGGRETYLYRCARCGKAEARILPDTDHMEENNAENA